ncbi:MAG: hypothetical protein ACE5GS_15165 [Kiloniellaceae bacterium]
MTLKWEGKAVTARMRRAMIAGVNQTMAAAVNEAKRSHAWQNRTGTLEGSIDIHDFAAPTDRGRGVRGLWGSRDVRYALIHELGGVIRPKTARALFIPDRAGGVAAVVAQVTIPARPYLRPAADKHYPSLSRRIRAAFERGSTARGGGA